MKLYAPKYYKNFKCIADKCTHSCCVGWEIDVDEVSLEKYKRLRCGYGAQILDSVSFDEVPHFKLGADERCPHLSENGLCKIICNLGEGYLCDICREHPRFYNYTGVCEVGIGASCEEAARVILSSPDYAEIEEIGKVDGKGDEPEFDARDERAKIYGVLGNKSLSYHARLEELYRRYEIDAGKDEEWLEKIESLEYLNTSHKELFLNYSGACRPICTDTDEYLERFLAYLIYRHATEAEDGEDFCLRLSFSLFCERLLASLICARGAKTLNEVSALARIISEEIEYSDDNTIALTY